MRPAEIFEKHPDADAYRVGGFYSPYCLLATEKRFSEAELCAEFEAARCDWMLTEATGSYWSPLGDTWPHDPDSVSNRVQTLLRMAARPHYDEAGQ